MIPYFRQPALLAAGILIPAFQVLVLAAIAIGLAVFHRRARRAGISAADRWGIFASAFIAGMIGAVLLKTMGTDYPMWLQRPFMVFHRYRGIASLGGLGGGLLGALAFCWVRRYSRRQVFAALDALAYAAPFAWLPGRFGCFLAHDHRGLFTSSWIGVRFPEGTRFDLGLIEILFLIPLSLVFWRLGRKPRPAGFFFVLFECSYGVFRIWLDTLHYQQFRFIGGALMVVAAATGWALARRARA